MGWNAFGHEWICRFEKEAAIRKGTQNIEHVHSSEMISQNSQS